MSGSYATETDGRHTIRVGQQGTHWAARAFRGRATATATLIGATRDEAVAAVREALHQLRIARRAARPDDGSPSAAEYRDALAQLAPLHRNDLAMLKAHAAAPDHLITATKLAQAAGYATWGTANLRYGLLAQRLAEQLDFEPPTRADGTTIWTATLATWDEADPARPTEQAHFEWRLRPQVRDVVRNL